MSDKKIEFVHCSRPTTSFSRKSYGEISAFPLDGNCMTNAPNLFEAKNFMESTLMGYYNLDRKYWAHKPLLISEDEKGVWLLYMKASTLIGIKLCGFTKI